jgi:hypothetical protein
MSLADWLLALHLIAAAVLIGAITWFAAATLAARRAARASDAAALLRSTRLAVPLVGGGSGAVLLLGLWLAIDEDAYHPWDPWILAAIVLWALATFTGQRAGVLAAPAMKLAAEQGDAPPDSDLRAALTAPEALRLQMVTIVSVALILLDMIFKPGA